MNGNEENKKEKPTQKALDELLGETTNDQTRKGEVPEVVAEKQKHKNDVENESEKNKKEFEEQITEENSHNKVYPVYILYRVIAETVNMCRKAMPNEAIGVLLGFKQQYKGQKFVKIVDWVTGTAYQSSAFAEFTKEGVQQYSTIIEERYGESENRPRIVGIIHSHPFGFEPHFSATDHGTFLNFPYDAEHNVFVLVDPKSGYYKTYIVVVREDGQKDLEEVDWVEYNAR